MNLLCYYSTTAAVVRMCHSIVVLGGLDHAAERSAHFPNHISSAVAPSCVDESRDKFPDRRALPHSKSLDGFDPPALAMSPPWNPWWCPLDTLNRVVVGDGNHHGL